MFEEKNWLLATVPRQLLLTERPTPLQPPFSDSRGFSAVVRALDTSSSGTGAVATMHIVSNNPL